MLRERIAWNGQTLPFSITIDASVEFDHIDIGLSIHLKIGILIWVGLFSVHIFISSMELKYVFTVYVEQQCRFKDCDS